MTKEMLLYLFEEFFRFGEAMDDDAPKGTNCECVIVNEIFSDESTFYI